MPIPYFSYAIASEKKRKGKEERLNQTTHMIVSVPTPPKIIRGSVNGGEYFYTRYCKAKATRTPVAVKVIADEVNFSAEFLEG